MERISDNLIRTYSDGELSETQAAEVERVLARDEQLRKLVEFERRLKDRVGQVMRSESIQAPAGLAQRVRAALSTIENETSATNESPLPVRADAGDALTRLKPRPVSPWNLAALLAGPQRVNVFAVAACLVLVSGAVLVGIFGRPIDTYSRPQLNMLTQAAEYVSREHSRCAGDERALHEKIKYEDAESAAAGLARHLGAPVLVPDLSKLGYEFQGGGPCQVPGDVRSGHLMYRKVRPDGRTPMVSIFIEPNHHQFVVYDGDMRRDLVPNMAFEFSASQACRPFMVFTDGPLVYFVTACDVRDLDGVKEVVKQDFHLDGR